MTNYICINGKQIELTEEQLAQIKASFREPEAAESKSMMLSQVAVGNTVRIGEHEMIVLEQADHTTALIRKQLLHEEQRFGDSNNYDGSDVDELCNEFADEICAAVGEENVVAHMVDLISDDGLKDYGKVERRCSLLTTDLYRRYVEILDNFKPDRWWWLATPHSTKRHENDSWVKCVSPSGNFISGDRYNGRYFGVRPFCILKSNIFVSA